MLVRNIGLLKSVILRIKPKVVLAELLYVANRNACLATTELVLRLLITLGDIITRLCAQSTD